MVKITLDMGRFLTKDTWNGNYNRPLSLNRWGYVYGNPSNLNDPSGHDPWWCDFEENPALCIEAWIQAHTHVSGVSLTATPTLPVLITATACATPALNPTGTPFATATSLSIEAQLASYDVSVDLAYLALEKRQAFLEATLEAIVAVDHKLSETVAGAGFKNIYNHVNITWGLGNTSGQCVDIKVGGCTSSRHQINFATISDNPLRARNNIVHEFGHAFESFWSNSMQAADRAHPENTNPAIVLSWTQGAFPAFTEYIIAGFPNRPNPTDGNLGGYYGFASQQNQLTWQVAVTNAGAPSEEFADQFLGWTFNTWQPADGINNYGVLRSDWMNRYMPGWINRILGR